MQIQIAVFARGKAARSRIATFTVGATQHDAAHSAARRHGRQLQITLCDFVTVRSINEIGGQHGIK
ncbi:MAG: hypothetical protein ACI4TG_00070 [Ruminococcus sp.]